MQIEQIETCTEAGADGVIIGAISYHGLNELVARLHRKGVPYLKRVGPHIYVIDKDNIDVFDRETSLAPGGFRATYATNIRLKAD